MNRIPTVLSATVLAAAMSAGAAFAAGEADKQPATGEQATPAGQQGGSLGAGPNVRDLDSNAQRAHSPTGETGATTSGDRVGADAPSVKDLDSTAQRAHDPQSGAQADGAQTQGGAGHTDASTDAAAPSGASGGTSAAMNTAASGETRDWSQVDANSDNLISPDEMEAALKEQGPQANPQR